MKSNKQRRAEIKKRLVKCADKVDDLNRAEASVNVFTGTAPCNPALLAPYNSYGVPPFVERGFLYRYKVSVLYLRQIRALASHSTEMVV